LTHWRFRAAVLFRDGCGSPHYASEYIFLTVVDYFTSTRELAGMRRLVDDDIAELASLQVATRRRRPRVDELTGRMPSSRIASTLAELERPFDPAADSTAALAEFRRDPAAALARAEGRVPPIDVLLATSMLQVGVDVQRLGLMVVTGQPKNTAEYIQATSRIGRDRNRPGVVVTIYQWSRPRDLAHYESFGYDHATFGLRVEGLTTTPFSDRALDRGLSAVLVTALRHSGYAALTNTAANATALSGPLVDALVADIQQRAERVTHDRDQADQVRDELRHRLDSWRGHRAAVTTGQLGYPGRHGRHRAAARPGHRGVGPVVGATQPARGRAGNHPPARPAGPQPGRGTGLELRPELPGTRWIMTIPAAAGAGQRRDPTRIGQARPSHLVTVTGVGAILDLPSMSVVVRGQDAWNPEHQDAIEEPRLLEAVRRVLPLDPPGQFELVHRFGRRPDLAKFVHEHCQKQVRTRTANKRACVPARFLVVCEDGHLDDFPYVEYVHASRGAPCDGPQLSMSDAASTLGPQVTVRCLCGASRNIQEAAGRSGWQKLPACRGRQTHLQRFVSCGKRLRLIVLGASNLWFGVTASALHLPQGQTVELGHARSARREHHCTPRSSSSATG
jgi:hypothetical protein